MVAERITKSGLDVVALGSCQTMKSSGRISLNAEKRPFSPREASLRTLSGIISAMVFSAVVMSKTGALLCLVEQVRRHPVARHLTSA